ncbi:uncharacterized protein LOC101208062 isoform X3 [Cucumis sativus]|uniref:uncharacterized protein LOC101208062 isoform X3 n=1 Tax=Cucumis sativus TaxID=3659 RepID=UPI0012F47930|nr:uncharacterized protein LOC101208062 isoform X3 [Cucumis sativus]KGN63377.2 hypothetical protein Csa_022292 [Cucumis sativus]
MALQAAGVSTSKVLILVGAGLTGSVVLRSGRLSDLISQLQELLKGVTEEELSPSPYKYDTAVLAAQIRQLTQEIRELTLSGPVTVFNGNSSSSAAVGAMGYCYMWWKGLSFSDVMFVTKQNMANAVSTVSKQLDNVHEALASTRRHLTKKLENLDWRLDEEIETTNLIANNVEEVKCNLSQIGFDVETIHQMVSQLEGKLEVLERKQNVTNSGLWYLCQAAEGVKGRISEKLFPEVEAKKIATVKYEENPLKGLQFIADTKDSIVKRNSLNEFNGEKVAVGRTRVHRSYPVGIALAPGIMGCDT